MIHRAAGFLVVEDFLTREEVEALNASFDANWDRRINGADNAQGKRRGFDQFHGMLSWPLPHSQPFRDLLAHRKLVVRPVTYPCSSAHRSAPCIAR